MVDPASLFSLPEFVEECKDLSSYDQVVSLRQKVIDTENKYREIFSKERNGFVVPEIENDKYRFLVDVYQNLELFRYLPTYQEDKVPRVFPLGENKKDEGLLGVMPSKEEFNFSWDALSMDQLRYLNWENVFAAGGAVSGCLSPLPKKVTDVEGKGPQMIARRKYFNDEFLPGSDIDLFLYALTEEEAVLKLKEIFNAVQAANPFEVKAFRSTHAISLISQYPFRHIQVVLRIYSSPAEVLMGFDVDACAVGYDGENVLVCPRTLMAIKTQSNLIDMSRRSPSYEMRLSKYAKRGFEVEIPCLDRNRVDPFIYESRFEDLKGLSRLLILEKLKTPEERLRYRLERQLASRGSKNYKLIRRLRQLEHDRWNIERAEDTAEQALNSAHLGNEYSDYATVYLPWGPNWTAEKIAKQFRKKDHIMNSLDFRADGTIVPIKRKFKLHLCAVGTMDDVVTDPYPKDPPIPEDVLEENKDVLVYGPVQWIVDNPGRQKIGSFHPIEDGEWTRGAHFTKEAEEFLLACSTGNAALVNEILDKHSKLAEDNTTDETNPSGRFLFARDFLGRSALHVAVLGGREDICKILLDHPFADSAFLNLRLPDGRHGLHLAAMKGHVKIMEMILNKIKSLAEELKKERDAEKENSIDELTDNAIPFYEVLDVDCADWELKLSPLQYAISLGHVEIVQKLLEFNADVNKIAVHKDKGHTLSPLNLLADYATECGKLGAPKIKPILELLIDYGVNFKKGTEKGLTCWHILAAYGHSLDIKDHPISVFMDSARAKGVDDIGLESLDESNRTPVYIATLCGNAKVLEFLLKSGASSSFSEALWTQLIEQKNKGNYSGIAYSNIEAERSPILQAVRKADVECLKIFLTHDPKLANESILWSVDKKLNLLNYLDYYQRILEKVDKEEKELREEDRFKQVKIIYESVLGRQFTGETVKYLENNTYKAPKSLEEYYYDLHAMKIYQEYVKKKNKLLSKEQKTEEDEERSATLKNFAVARELIVDNGGVSNDFVPEIPTPFRWGRRYNNKVEKVDSSISFIVMNNKDFHSLVYNNYGYYNYGRRKNPLPEKTTENVTALMNACINGSSTEILQLGNVIKFTMEVSSNVLLSPLFLAVMSNKTEAVMAIFDVALKQYKAHHDYVKACEDEKERQMEQLRKKIPMKDSKTNPVKNLMNSINNSELAQKGKGQTKHLEAITPDEIRAHLSANDETSSVNRDPNYILSNIPAEQLLFSRSELLVGSLEDNSSFILENLRKANKANNTIEDDKLDKDEIQEIVKLNPFELAVLKEDTEMVKSLIECVRSVFKSKVKEISEEEDQAESTSSDTDDSGLYTDSDYDYGDLEVRREKKDEFTEAQLKYILFGHGSSNSTLGGLNLIELAIMTDNMSIVKVLLEYGREVWFPMDAAHKILRTDKFYNKKIKSCLCTEYVRSQTRNIIHFIVRNSKDNTSKVSTGFLNGELDNLLSDWLFDEEYILPKCSKDDNQCMIGINQYVKFIRAFNNNKKLSKEETKMKLYSIYSVDRMGRNGFFYAADHLLPVLSNSLSDSDIINSVSDSGVSRLMVAAVLGEYETVKTLLKLGCKRTIKLQKDKRNILHVLINNFSPELPAKKKGIDRNEILIKKKIEMIELILEDASNDDLDELLLCHDTADNTPLMLSVYDKDLVKYFIHQTAKRAMESLQKTNSDKNSLLHNAVKQEMRSVQTIVENLPVDICQTILTSENMRGYTPLDLMEEKVLQVWTKQKNYSFVGYTSKIMKKNEEKLKPNTELERDNLNLLQEKARNDNNSRKFITFDEVKHDSVQAVDSALKKCISKRERENDTWNSSALSNYVSTWNWQRMKNLFENN